MSVDQVDNFKESCNDWLQELILAYFQDATASVESMAVEVSPSTPKYSSFLNDKQYHKAICKRQLLEWLGRNDLPGMILKLYKAASCLKELHAEWTKLDVALPAVDAINDNVVLTLTDAKKAVATIAGVEAVQATQGAQQTQLAIKVLAKAPRRPNWRRAPGGLLFDRTRQDAGAEGRQAEGGNYLGCSVIGPTVQLEDGLPGFMACLRYEGTS